MGEDTYIHQARGNWKCGPGYRPWRGHKNHKGNDELDNSSRIMETLREG